MLLNVYSFVLKRYREELHPMTRRVLFFFLSCASAGAVGVLLSLAAGGSS